MLLFLFFSAKNFLFTFSVANGELSRPRVKVYIHYLRNLFQQHFDVYLCTYNTIMTLSKHVNIIGL